MKKLFALAFGLTLLATASWGVTPFTTMADVNLTASSTDVRIVTTTAFTAARTLTLPFAGATCIGQTCAATALEIIDNAGAITNTNTLTIAPQSGDTINGSASSVVISGARDRVILWPLSGSNWYLQVVGASGQILGTTTNDNACTGCVGEFQSSAIASSFAAAVLLAPAAPQNVTQLLLTAGDWDCRGNVGGWPSFTTPVSAFAAWTSTASAADYAANSADNGSRNAMSAYSGILTATAIASQQTPQLLVGAARYSLAASTSVFLSTKATFSGTMSAYGFLGCRRVR